MSESRFSIGEAVGYGWEAMKNKFWFFVGMLVVSGLVYFIPNIVLTAMGDGENFSPVSFMLSVVVSIVNLGIGLGILKICLKIFDQQDVSIGDLFSCFQPLLMGRVILASILNLFAVLAGLILLVIPGIILGLRLQFFSYLIIDKGLSAIEALKKSFEMTKGATLDLFLFSFLSGIISFAGILCLLVGAFAAIPTIYMAQVYIFRKLVSDGELVLDVSETSGDIEAGSVE